MSNIVYLLCSLPSLTFGQSPPISFDEFMADANSQLSAKSYQKLEITDFHKKKLKTVKGKLKSFTDMMGLLQGDVTEIRKSRRERRTPNLQVLPLAVLSGNPLEREKQILQWQWDELSTIEAGETFSFTAVLVYKLKLQILSRLHSFNAEQGAKVLASVVNPKNEGEDS